MLISEHPVTPVKTMRLLSACFMILALQASFACFAQSQDDQYQLWRIRAQTITDDLLNDGRQLAPLRRAVLSARLGERWWGEDPRRAAAWFKNSIETVEQIPNKENPGERRERLETARLLLQVIAPLERKLAGRLVTLLNNQDALTADERNDNADGLIATAVLIAEKDPSRAAEFGTLALRLGPPHNIYLLLFELRKRDEKLADRLFLQALAIAKEDPTGQFVGFLNYAAFPAERGLSGDVPPVPDHLRTQVLQLQVAFLNASAINGQDGNLTCAIIAGSIAPVLPEFDRLLPQQAPLVRQAIDKCQSAPPLLKQHLNNNLPDQPLNTVDALLSAAADEKDIKVRTVYAFRAAALAKENKEYELALRILDEMGKESREFMGESWVFYRWDWAATGAVEHYKQGRLVEMNRILNAVPAHLQPIAKAVFVDRLPDKRELEGDPAIQFINEVRTGLRRSNLTETDKYGCYFVLLRSIVKYDPSQTSAVLKDAIATLNRAESSEEKAVRRLDVPPYSKMMPASLLEVDEFGVKEGLASVTLVETRAKLRLELLESTLERMHSAH